MGRWQEQSDLGRAERLLIFYKTLTQARRKIDGVDYDSLISLAKASGLGGVNRFKNRKVVTVFTPSIYKL